MKLKNVAKVQIGISAPKTFDEKSESTVPFIRAGIVEDLCNNNAKFNEYLEKSKYKTVPKGTVIFAKSGMSSLKNRIYTLKEEVVIVGHLAGIICNEDIILPDYLEYYFKYNKPSRLIKNDSYPSIRTEDIENIDIEIPSIETQKKIILKLRKIQKLISIKKHELLKYDQLIKSQFVEMFGDVENNSKGYEVKPMSAIADYWNGLTYKPSDINESGTIVLRASNIQDSSLDFNDIVRVNCNIGEKKYVKENDILMCSRNGSARLVGKVALIPKLEEQMAFGAFMMIIRSSYYPYLYSYFQTNAFRKQIVSGATTTINQVTTNIMNNVKLPVPEEKELKRYNIFLKQVDKQKFEFEKQLKKLEELQASLMQEYFG